MSAIDQHSIGPTSNIHVLSEAHIDNRGGVIQISLTGPASTSIFEALRPYICIRATFDGDDRDDAPKCHPETRKSIIGDIESWPANIDEESGILWMRGPVGTGKSAIARKVCEDLNRRDPRLIAGSFFFWRNDSDRNSLKNFIATIAYRLSIIFPQVGDLIRLALANDPFAMDRSLEVQWDTLIIKPLRLTLQDTGYSQ
ncbi:hypothetical protein AX16_005970 [Volvariella volvacea WC 439]|nr:hypothetical protein AX16_005970 [Volvariella volvacea WC 439]